MAKRIGRMVVPAPAGVSGLVRSQPGVVLDVLLKLSRHFLGQSAPGLLDTLQDVCRGSQFLAVLEQDALEYQLRGPPGGELDVGWGEQPALIDNGLQVNLRVRQAGQVPGPDRLPRRIVRRPDRNEVIEPAMPQERGVQVAD